MSNNTNKNRYGHLLDKYMDSACSDYRTKGELEEEARSRYGNLLDKAKPDNSVYEHIINLDRSCRENQRKREEEYRQMNERRQQRIEREKLEHEQRVAKNDAFVNSFLEKKEAERKAAEEKRLAAEREQHMYDSIQRAINARDELKETAARTNAMLAWEQEQRKAHEEKMEWYRQQEKCLRD